MRVALPSFNHNLHTAKIVTVLEQSLCRLRRAEPCAGRRWRASPSTMAPSTVIWPTDMERLFAGFDLELHTHASAEAQVAALSDDIAYNTHDVDDGLRAGLLRLRCRVAPMLRLPARALRDIDADFSGPACRQARFRSRPPDDFRADRRRAVATAGVCWLRIRGRPRTAQTSARTRQHGHRVLPGHVRRLCRNCAPFLFANLYRHPLRQPPPAQDDEDHSQTSSTFTTPALSLLCEREGYGRGDG